MLTNSVSPARRRHDARRQRRGMRGHRLERGRRCARVGRPTGTASCGRPSPSATPSSSTFERSTMRAPRRSSFPSVRTVVSSGPKRSSLNAICCSSVRAWSWKTSTERSSKARAIWSKVASSSGRVRSTPATSAAKQRMERRDGQVPGGDGHGDDPPWRRLVSGAGGATQARRAAAAHSVPPCDRIRFCAALPLRYGRVGELVPSPRVPPTAQARGVRPCLLRWLGSEPASRRAATTAGRPENAAHPSGIASFSASRSDGSAPYLSRSPRGLCLTEFSRHVERIRASRVGRADGIGETTVRVEERGHAGQIAILHRMVQILGLRHSSPPRAERPRPPRELGDDGSQCLHIGLEDGEVRDAPPLSASL